MNRRSFLISSAIAMAGCAKPLWANQGPPPTHNATIVVGFSAGGAGDLAGRVAAEYAKQSEGFPVGVEFRPGAGGTIATDQIRRAAPDGTTLSLFSASPLVVAPHLQKLPYDPLKDFTYIATFVNISIPMFVTSQSPHKSWTELITFAKANPGKLRWATAAPRGLAHISTEAAFRQEGVQAAFVPFSGGADAITALLGGHIEAVVASDYASHLQSGKIRLLVETGSEPIANYPDVPTFKQLGYPLALSSGYGLFGPADLPKSVVSWWEDELRAMTESPLYQTFLTTLGGQRGFQGHEQFTATVTENYRIIGEQVDLLGLRP